VISTRQEAAGAVETHNSFRQGTGHPPPRVFLEDPTAPEQDVCVHDVGVHGKCLPGVGK
jgi:hypothetical protein